MQEPIIDKKAGNNIIASLCVSTFFGATLFFFGPAHLYFSNILEYSSSFSEVVPFFIVASAVAIVLTTVVLLSLPYLAYEKAVSLLLVLALLLWFQGNVLVWDYGLLDGRAIDWKAYITRGIIDGAVWLVFIVVGFVAANPLGKVARQVSVAFVMVQLISVLIVALRAPDASRLREKSSEEFASIYKFSPERNVMILVLDAFQGDIFQEIINESSHYRDIFEGFTYYRNALSGYSHTSCSVALILTGRYFENTVPMAEFLRKAFLTKSIPRILTRNGYQVDLLGGGSKVYPAKKVVSNSASIKALAGENVRLREATNILDVTLFRYFPHVMKKYIYNEQAWLLGGLGLEKALGELPAGGHRDSIEFMKKMAHQAKASSNRYTFKYIHLTIPHGPMMVNEQLKYERLAHNRHDYKRQSKAALELAKMLINALKQIGVYENTMIFVIADHGDGIEIIMEDGDQRQDGGSGLPIRAWLKSRALPLFLVKPFTSTGDMKISDAPVSLADISKTIISELGLRDEIPGVSVFEIDESDIRERRYLDHESGRGLRQHYEFPPLKEYIISGYCWNDESWQQTCKLYTSQGVKDISPEKYQYGTYIHFGRDRNYQKYQGIGWSYPEDGFTWTDGKKATLLLPICKTESDVVLKAKLRPHLVFGGLDEQRVKISVHDGKKRRPVGEWVMTKDELKEQAILIPSDYMTRDIAKIFFELPDAVSPVELGIGSDPRRLGICMYSIVLTESASDAEISNRMAIEDSG